MGWVVIAAIGAIPAAGLAAWWLTGRRGWRAALCDVGMVIGTAPWLWMIFTPTGTGRSVNLVPLRDLAEQLADDRVIEQFGGNLLVFAALASCCRCADPGSPARTASCWPEQQLPSRWRLHSSPSLSAVTHPSTTCC
ncbi:hypothetical protein [Nocardia pneumoniae]|uniref:hypothetical protein n=1 Tax=Nocardia pneumoniae TaxID=228601 RepID=UPI001FDF3467|nr:hypothetical protein [Nocardia pneumoniae]